MNATLLEFNSYCIKRKIVEADMSEKDFLPIPVGHRPGPRPFKTEREHKISVVYLRQKDYWQAMRKGKYVAGAKTKQLLLDRLEQAIKNSEQ